MFAPTDKGINLNVHSVFANNICEIWKTVWLRETSELGANRRCQKWVYRHVPAFAFEVRFHKLFWVCS